MTVLANEAAAKAFCAERTDGVGMDRLTQLAAMLIEENARQNLISSASEHEIWLRHFADSAQLLDHVPRETAPWLDLGTGAGFPGLIIANLRPEQPCFLVESRRRRTEWLEQVVAALGLQNCRVHASRLENIEAFDAAVISARAFAPLDKLLRLSARFSTRETHWVLPKGQSAGQELSQLPKALRGMFHVEPSLTSDTAGILVGKGRPKIA